MPGLWSVIHDKIYGFLTAPEQWYQNPKIQALKVFFSLYKYFIDLIFLQFDWSL